MLSWTRWQHSIPSLTEVFTYGQSWLKVQNPANGLRPERDQAYQSQQSHR